MKKEACNHQIGVRVTKSKWQEIETIARAMKITGTEYCRRAIDAQLAYDRDNNHSDNQYVTRREVENIVRRILCEEKAEYKTERGLKNECISETSTDSSSD